MKYLFLIFVALMLPNSVSAVWFDSNWDYRVKVEVAPSKVGSSTAITNFPVYVDLAGMPTTFFTNASSSGADIRVVESDETTETAFELVSIATTTKRGELHFMADTLSTTSTSTFYIYYGNSNATAYAVTDTYGRNNVWTGYSAVYHLNDTTDAKGTNNLTNVNSVAFNSAQITNGGDPGTPNTNKRLHYTLTGDPYGIASNGTFSMTAWMKSRSAITSSPAFRKPLSLSIKTGFVYYQYLELYNSGTPTFTFGRTRYGAADANVTVTHTVPTANFNKYDMIYDGTNLTGYINSTLQGTTSATGSGSFWSANQSGLGIQATVVDVNGWSPTLVDEVRVSTSVLSSSWLTTEYNNQSSTSTFFYIGAEETESGGSPATSTDSGIIWFD